MRIKSYQCNRFAGLRDMKVEFSEGLNVILGDNESGKSTIINGIHSTLFKNIRLKGNNNADINFSSKFMPKPTGDYIDGRVTIKTKDGQHEIYKEWGSKEGITFTDSSGSILKNEKDINVELFKLLGYGESTYSNIVFAKQEDLKIALKSIIENSQVTDEISDLLRKTMMELEGISIDKIEKDIELEIENLYKRWDREKNRPQNNRGVNNPYKTGIGTILASYYKKEELLLLMEKTERIEKTFEDICKNMKELEEEIEPLKIQKIDLEKVEEDVNNRSIVEVEVSALKKELEDLLDANKSWPRAELLLEQYEEKIVEIEEEKEKLNTEKINIEKEKTKISLEKKLEKIMEKDENIKTITAEISEIPAINDDNIKELREVKAEIERLETTMKASKMLGKLVKSRGEDVYISKDFGPEEKLELDQPFEANGVIKIVYKDEFELEIKTGDIDYKELSKQYKLSKESYEKLLREYQIEGIEEGKNYLERRRQLDINKKTAINESKYILDDMTKEELEAKIKELSDIKVYRSLEEIEELISKNNKEELNTLTDERSERDKIKNWKEKYTDYDNLVLELIDKRGELKTREDKLKELKPLPEEFKTAEEFRRGLNEIKEKLRINQEELENLQPIFYETQGNMSDTTYEEVKKEYIDAQNLFEINSKKGEKFLEIQKVFLQTKEELSNNPMRTLVEEFARLLEIITSGDYKESEIDEKFAIKLENQNGEIPIELLSAGTHDSVTLALRFALLKHIFPEDEGYLVLDDCLVDLDPARKKQSVELINEFAKDYQVIFTTCDPQTANMLGGNRIDL